MNQRKPVNSQNSKRVAIYARVSSEEQTKGNYPSCTTQVEELEVECAKRGWLVVDVFKDEGVSAGSLKRPKLSEMRWLIQNGDIDVVFCTWYDRLTRSRDFFELDKEFKANNVAFVTLHDPTDTTTASGRFMESVFVAAKTFEREQTSEKVRTKFKQRAEKGMFNGGKTPFGFKRLEKEKDIWPDPELLPVVNGIFRTYIETGSEHKVRDFLQANHIKTRSGKSHWQVSSITRILTNRRYIAQVEINPENKGLADVPEAEMYRVAMAAYEPLVPVDVFEAAQRLREQNSQRSPNRVGRPRTFSQTQCERVFSLQGLMLCKHCKATLSPYYIRHRAGQDKSGKKRNKDSFICYYCCNQQVKGWKACGHKNSVLARKAEAWVIKMINAIVFDPEILEEAVEQAKLRRRQDFEPLLEAARFNAESLRKVEEDIEAVVEPITSGKATGALWDILNERAYRLKYERDQLVEEQRRLKERVSFVHKDVDVPQLRDILRQTSQLIQNSPPEEAQQLLRLLIHRIEWAPQPKPGERQGNHHAKFYLLDDQKLQPAHDKRERAGVLYCGTQRYPVGDSNP